MERRKRKSINLRKSFYLPRNSDVQGELVNPEQVEILRDISVAAQPSLISLDGGPVIPEDSNVSLAELKKRFPNDHEWYNRLSDFSRHSVTPRAQRKSLRLPAVDDAAENSSNHSGEEASIASQKPFRKKKKKQLFTHSLVIDEALEGDATLIENQSDPERSTRSVSNVSLPVRRSGRLLERSSAVVDSSSSVESPRENFRLWKSIETRKKSSRLAEAIRGLQKSNAGETIKESNESANLCGPSSSDDAQRISQPASLFKAPPGGENEASSSSEESSLALPSARQKLFGKARKRHRFSIGSILDETSYSVESAAKSPIRTSSRHSVVPEEERSIAKDFTRTKLFAKKIEERKRRFSAFGKVLDANDSERTVDESQSAGKSADNEIRDSSKKSSGSLADESPILPVGQKLFAKLTRRKRGSSAFAEALEAEDSYTFSTAEAELMEGAAVDGNRPSVANESRNPQRKLEISARVGSTSKDSVHLGVSRVDAEADSSPTERRQLFAGSSEKSARTSAFVAVLDDDQPLTEVDQGGHSSPAQTASKVHSIEQKAFSPVQDTSPGRSRVRQWAVAKERERLTKFDEIMSMDCSTSLSSNIEAGDKENVPDLDRSALLDEEEVRVSENEFVVPAVPSKVASLLQRLSGIEFPRVVIEPLRFEAVTSTPTPNATKMVLLSSISDIKTSSKGPFQDSLPGQSAEETLRVAHTQLLAENKRGSPSGPVHNSHRDQDSSAANPRSIDELSQEKPYKSGIGNDLHSNAGETSSSKSPPVRKSTASVQQPLQTERKSLRQITRSENAEESSSARDEEEDSPSSAKTVLLSTSKSLALEQQHLLNRKQSPRHVVRSLNAEGSSEEEVRDGDLSASAERVLSSSSWKTPEKRRSVASEQQKWQKGSQSLRRTAPSENADKTPEDKNSGVDLPSSAKRNLLLPSSKSPQKRSYVASEQQHLQNIKQSSRRILRSANADQSSSEDDGDKNLPSSAERALSSSSSKAPQKRRSVASEQQQLPNKKQSLRRAAPSENADKTPEDKNSGVDLPSSAKRNLLLPSSKSPQKRSYVASEQQHLQNIKQSSRRILRSANADQSSSEDDGDKNLPSSAERALSSSSSKAPQKRRSVASEQQQLPNRKQSLRRAAPSENADNIPEEENRGDDLPLSVKRSLSSPSSKTPRKRRSVASQQQHPQNRKQSSRYTMLSGNAEQSSEEDGRDEEAERVLSSPQKPGSTVSEQQQLQKRRNSWRRTARFESSEGSSEQKNEEYLPSSAERVLSSYSSPKQTPPLRKTAEKKRRFSPNVDPSSEASNPVKRTSKSSSMQTSSKYDSGRGPRGSTFPSDALVKYNSIFDSVEDDSTESEEESNPRPTSAAKGKLADDTSRRKLSAASITLHPSESFFGVSSRSFPREVETKAKLPKERTGSDIVGKSPEVISVLSDVATSVQTHASGPQEAAATSEAEAALRSRPRKSVLPQRVRPDIRNFFVKSTPLKEHQSGDNSDPLVPFDVTRITPIKKLNDLSDESAEDSFLLPRKVATGGQNEEHSPVNGVGLKPSNEKIRELLNKLKQGLPQKKDAPSPPPPTRVFLKAAELPGKPKPVRKKFQLILPDGNVYIQPKLPKPRKFVTDKMYRFITTNIKDNSNLNTRVRAEEFVKRLCDTYGKVLRRKNTKSLVEELLKDMVLLGLVSTYREFYTFVEKFMPFSFRMKAIPCIGKDLAPNPRKGIDEKLDFDV